MPISYFETLKTQLTEAATAKKAALDAAYDRATTATFDASGKPTYKKDAAGNNIYGTRDVQHLENVRNIGVGAEASGTLRSGQNQRNLINNEADYRADVLAASTKLTADKNLVDTETGTKTAEYQALYGDKAGAGSGAVAGPAAGSAAGLAPATAPPARTSTVTSGGKTTVLTPAQQSAWANALKNVPASRAGNRTPVPAVPASRAGNRTPAPAPAKAPAKTVVPKRIGGY
jgi:hypothetical protein